MYYSVGPYFLTITVLMISTMVILSFWIFKFANKAKDEKVALYAFASITVAVALLMSTEIALHLLMQKHSISFVTLPGFFVVLLLFSFYARRIKAKPSAFIKITALGTVAYFSSCIPIIVWFNCATTSTCF